MYLRMCPSIEHVTQHLLTEYPKSVPWFKNYNEKLKRMLSSLTQ